MENEEFLKIVQQTRWQLLRLCERFLAETRTAAVAEDVVQETYLRLWQMRHKMKEFESPEALAVTIAKNICIDIRRKTPNDSIEIVGLDFAGGTSACHSEKSVATEKRRYESGRNIRHLPDHAEQHQNYSFVGTTQFDESHTFGKGETWKTFIIKNNGKH